MNLARTLTIVIGLAAACAVLTFGLLIGRGQSGATHTVRPPASAGAPACVTVVAEHAACALTPRHADQGARSLSHSDER